jgi:hypothetical protein
MTPMLTIQDLGLLLMIAALGCMIGILSSYIGPLILILFLLFPLLMFFLVFPLPIAVLFVILIPLSIVLAEGADRRQNEEMARRQNK